MKLKRIQSRPLRMFLLIFALPFIIYDCTEVYFDRADFMEFIKGAWRQ